MATVQSCKGNVEIDNNTVYTLINSRVFTVSGIYEKSFPSSIGHPGYGSGWFISTPEKTDGVRGVITYDLQNDTTGKCFGKMAVMFSVPFDSKPNKYAVGVCDVSRECDDSLYEEMHDGKETWFVRGKAKDSLTYKGKDVTIGATMTDSKTSVIKVHVSN